MKPLTGIPHPNRAAVDAAADRLMAVFCKIQGRDRVSFTDLDAVSRNRLGTWALEILNDATPYLAINTAASIAALLDSKGDHAAATRIHALVDEWTAAAPPALLY